MAGRVLTQYCMRHLQVGEESSSASSCAPRGRVGIVPWSEQQAASMGQGDALQASTSLPPVSLTNQQRDTHSVPNLALVNHPVIQINTAPAI